MNTRSSTCAGRHFAPEFLSNQLQTISEQRHFSEQPEDVVSLNTDPEDLTPSRARGHGFPPAGGPPGDEPPIDDNDSDVSSIDSHPDTDQIVKKLFKCLAQPTTPADPGSHAKVCEPKVHDGTDQAKLRTFFLQCMLNFRDRPSAFKTDALMIQYAISYLSGPALQYFEPAILGEIRPKPAWLSI